MRISNLSNSPNIETMRISTLKQLKHSELTNSGTPLRKKHQLQAASLRTAANRFIKISSNSLIKTAGHRFNCKKRNKTSATIYKHVFRPKESLKLYCEVKCPKDWKWKYVASLTQENLYPSFPDPSSLKTNDCQSASSHGVSSNWVCKSLRAYISRSHSWTLQQAP